MSVMIFLGLCAVLGFCDWKRRTVPRLVTVLGAAAAGFFFAQSAVWGLLTGAAVALVADLPAGDVMVGAMIGGWLGIEGTLFAWGFALTVGNLIWMLWEERIIDWPGEWPFTPLLLVPACAIVAGKGG